MNVLVVTALLLLRSISGPLVFGKLTDCCCTRPCILVQVCRGSCINFPTVGTVIYMPTSVRRWVHKYRLRRFNIDPKS